jgi:vitamin B12 transporter
MKKEKKVWAILLIAFWWAPNKTSAQDSLSATTLREVVITATKFPKRVSETGKVVTIIDEDQLTRAGGKDLSQVLNEQAGLVINGANSNPAKDKSVFLRGAAARYTLILIDGIPVNDPSGIDGAFDLRLLSLDQVQRIEILKGSQSTLYGTDAVAGVINIITKKKSDKPLTGQGTLSYGSYQTGRANAAVSGSSGKMDYHLGYTRFQTRGLSEAEDRNGQSNFDKDGFRQNAFQLNFGFKPNENFSLRPFVRYNDFNGDFDTGPFTDDATAVYDASTWNAGLNAEAKFKNGAVNFLLANNSTERSYENSFGTFQYDGRFNHGEVFTSYNLKRHLQLLGGFSYQHFRMMATNTVIKNPSSDMASPYLSLFINNVKGFSAEAGVRFVNHSVYGSNFTYSINPSWLVKERFKLFANYSTGFKAPSLTQLYGPFGANEDLLPEESKSLEGGIQFFSRNKKSDFRVTYFSRQIDNIIAYTLRYENWEKLNDRGVELEAYYRLGNFTLSGNYMFVDGEVITQTEKKPNDLIRRPKHSLGATIGCQPTKKIFASLNFKTFGKRNDLFFDFDTFSSQAVVLDAYQLLDVYAEYKCSDRVKVFGDFRNLLNQSYYEVYGYNTQRVNLYIGIQVGF